MAKIKSEYGHIKCPLCGSEMSFSAMDGGWFCYGPSMSGRCSSLPVLEKAFKKNATEDDKRKGHPHNPFQWNVVATVEKDGSTELILTTTRSGSQSNIKIERPDRKEVDANWANEIVQKHGWVWVEWCER